MEEIKKYFFSDLGVMLGRSMRHIFRFLYIALLYQKK